MPQSIEEHDSRKRRCPMLGHELHFSYCRKPGSEIPCRKIFDCWWQAFDIKAFMEANYSRETLDQLLSPPKDRATSLLELIQQAQKRAEGGSA